MTGSVALHGGGEFLPGDEPFLGALVEMAPIVDGVVRIAIVPTAAARGRPEAAAAHGVAAFDRVAKALGYPVSAEAVHIVDGGSAMDPQLADRLAAATLIHLPGGDPDLIPALYPGTAAWAAMQTAHAGGAVLAGASAGGMALAGWTWTRAGGVPGLGVVPGVVVVPHADARSWARSLERFGSSVPLDFGALGIAERTGVIVTPGEPWRVAGEGEVRWLPPGTRDPDAALVVGHGGTIEV